MNKGLLAFKDLTKGHYLGQGEYEVLCDFVEKELKKPQQLYNYIKQKEYNAEIDYEKERKREKGDILVLNELQGEIKAYHDIVCLMESMFGVENNGKR